MSEVDQLKEIIRELLWQAVGGGNGGYYTQFGPVLMSKMVKATNYDLNKRRACGFKMDGTKITQNNDVSSWLQIRTKAGLSLRQVADKTKVSISTISRVERGKDCKSSTYRTLVIFYNEMRRGIYLKQTK
jgi:hypothetical protein